MMAQTQSLRRRLFTPTAAVLFGDGTGEVTVDDRVFAIRHKITRTHPRGVYLDASGKRWDLTRTPIVMGMGNNVVKTDPAEALKLKLFGSANPVPAKKAGPVVTKASRKAKAINKRIAAKVGRVRKPTARTTGARKPAAVKKAVTITKTITNKTIRKGARLGR